jgi:hypothetical protein
LGLTHRRKPGKQPSLTPMRELLDKALMLMLVLIISL